MDHIHVNLLHDSCYDNPIFYDQYHRRSLIVVGLLSNLRISSIFILCLSIEKHSTTICGAHKQSYESYPVNTYIPLHERLQLLYQKKVNVRRNFYDA